ncbi:hypothetical protein BHE74_00018296 [Ensete ventricosum]|nr:hypothetical protein GW17_00023294 [Ensete ventricosum]RWW73793.1 hypothetical protein BHE74_00018296 [Ensete ventricosum]
MPACERRHLATGVTQAPESPAKIAFFASTRGGCKEGKDEDVLQLEGGGLRRSYIGVETERERGLSAFWNPSALIKVRERHFPRRRMVEGTKAVENIMSFKSTHKYGVCKFAGIQWKEEEVSP